MTIGHDTKNDKSPLQLYLLSLLCTLLFRCPFFRCSWKINILLLRPGSGSVMIYGSDIDKIGRLHTKEFLSEWLHGLVNIFCSL